jgi:hypothetical protein
VRRGLWIALATLALGGCAHTTTTDDGTEKKEEPKAEKERAAKAERRDAEPRGTVPVATKPEALLAPGADEKIRERLVANGYLADDAKPSVGAMRDSIRRFQRAQDLPATGVPDHETVERLGLDPDETFRRGTVKD